MSQVEPQLCWTVARTNRDGSERRERPRLTRDVQSLVAANADLIEKALATYDEGDKSALILRELLEAVRLLAEVCTAGEDAASRVSASIPSISVGYGR